MSDGSGLAFQSLAKQKGWELAQYQVVPDDETKIQNALLEWCDKNIVSVVLTTGGTGLCPRDVTPEATKKVVEKEIPGIGEFIRIEGLK